MTKHIRGAGGDNSSSAYRAPVEAVDSLQSKEYAQILDGLCEGPIYGLLHGLQSVFLNDTPLQNIDGTMNFSGVGVDARVGTQTQSYIPGFSDVQDVTAVSTELKHDTPLTRSLVNPNANAVRVIVAIPRLTTQDPKSGDINGATVELAIDIQTNGGGWVQKVLDTIDGKLTTRYQRSYDIVLTNGGPWDVRLRRITEDSSSSNLANATTWESFTEIVYAKLAYPNTALAAVSVDAQQFSSIPSRSYEILGMLVQYPSNYDPITRTYNGTWNGQFTTGWTNNPAWCFYDLVTNTRYGLGKYIQAVNVDKWSLYAIGQYCDVLVSNGRGGVEPRFTCNLYLQTQAEAIKLLMNMASIFRGMVYAGAGTIVPTQDSPKSVTAQFTRANVIDGKFTYTGTAKRDRHTVALITWNDPSFGYQQKIEYVEDREGIARYGYRPTSVVAFGCTSRGQAHRMGKFILFTERLETEIVQFKCGLDGLMVAPGDVIQTSDPMRSGTRLGGRLLAATTTALTLDAPVTLNGVDSHIVTVLMPDGTMVQGTVTNGSGTTDTLHVSPPLPDTPLKFSVWVLATTAVNPEIWRIISIAESDSTACEITALTYDEQKYDAIEKGLTLHALPRSSLRSHPDPVQNLGAAEALYLVTPVVVGAKLTVTWNSPSPYFEIRYRAPNGNWQLDSSTVPTFDINQVVPGDWTISVVAVNSLGFRAAAQTIVKTVYGLTSPPADVTNFSLTSLGKNGLFRFDPAFDLDVLVGGYLRIRHTPVTTGAQWGSSVDIAEQVPGIATNCNLPMLNGTYMAKWVDSSGNESVNMASVITTAPDIEALDVVQVLTENPTFTGTKVHVAVVPGGGALQLDSAGTIASQPGNVSTFGLLSTLGGLQKYGEYYFAQECDLSSVQVCRITAIIKVAGFDTNDQISGRGLISAWPMASGGNVTDVNCELQIRTTQDNPASSPTWDAWRKFMVTDYSARAFQFRAIFTSGYASHNIEALELSVIVNMPDKLDNGKNVVSGATACAILYNLSFMVPPALGITAKNMASGDYYVITGEAATGFSITFKNAAGTAISRTFDWIAKGR
jgi:predicted phage tail protein